MSSVSPTQIAYLGAEPILVAVDCIVFGFDGSKLKLLIFKREVDPLAGRWSLIGSFVKKNEGITEAASRVLSELSGIEDIYMEQLHCYGNPQRDSGARVISVAYWSLIKVDPNRTNFHIKNHISTWIDIDAMPGLVLDHSKMVIMAINRLKERAMHKPIGFELIPEIFTLPQLLNVYEAIFQRDIDDRNFRKKIMKSGLLIKTDYKDKSTSKKGSFLYKFNDKRYKELSEIGYNFEI
ncbi:MAG: NUDIX domain-containing protein [Bacteroidota bacterium]